MFFKKQKKIDYLTRRVKEFEEMLCPYENHDYVEIKAEYFYDIGGGVEAHCKYKCRRCGKIKWEWEY